MATLQMFCKSLIRYEQWAQPDNSHLINSSHYVFMSRLKGGQCNTTFCAKIIQVYNLENAFDENDLPPLCPQVHSMAQVVNTLVKTRQTSCCPPSASCPGSSAASRAATSGSSTSATTYLMGILRPPTISTQWVTSKFWRLLLLHEAHRNSIKI